jgi:hypothetical protein
MTRDDILRQEAAFADSQYARYANDLAIDPNMFSKYTHPRVLWDMRQVMARYLGDCPRGEVARSGVRDG